MSKTPQELGLEFQTEFQRSMEEIRNHRKVEIVRLYDTHAAGSILPAQGGDFIMMFQKRGFLIDTKLSTVHRCLSECLKSSTSETQMSRMRLWSRAGGVSLLVFKGRDQSIEIWEVNRDLLDAYYTARKKPDPLKSMVGMWRDEKGFPEFFLELLTELYKEPKS